MHYRLFVFKAMQPKRHEQQFSAKYNYESPVHIEKSYIPPTQRDIKTIIIIVYK